MYEKVAIVTVSIEKTVSFGQGERSPDTDDSYFPKIVLYVYVSFLERPIRKHIFKVILLKMGSKMLRAYVEKWTKCIFHSLFVGICGIVCTYAHVTYDRKYMQVRNMYE